MSNIKNQDLEKDIFVLQNKTKNFKNNFTFKKVLVSMLLISGGTYFMT